MSTVSRTPDGTEDQLPFSPLVGQILTKMFTDSAAVTNQVMDDYQRQIDDLSAELYAVRHGVAQLLDGPYMPTPDAIRAAVFFPTKELINEYEASKGADW